MPVGKDRYTTEEALDLISAVSRDLKVPLHLIKGLNDLMASGKISPEKYDLYIRRIASSVTQMERTLETIETINQVVAEQEQVSLEPININEVITTVADQLDAKAKDYDQKIIMQRGSKSTLVLSNRKILENATYLLLDNAIVFSEPNSDILIRPSRTPRKGFTRLTIRDKSMGVTKGDWNRIMKSLGKMETPNPAHPGDSGLGLFATVKLIDSLDGFVGMKTFRGGSSFYLEIPIAKQLDLGITS